MNRLFTIRIFSLLLGITFASSSAWIPAQITGEHQSDVQTSSATLLQAPIVIAVMPFRNDTGVEAFNWMSLALQDALTMGLYYLRAFQTRGLLEIVNDLQQTPTQMFLMSAEEYAQAGQKLYADMLLVGQYEIDRENLTIHAQLMEPKTGAIRGQSEVKGLRRNILTLSTTFLLDILQNFGVDVSAEERTRITLTKSKNLEAVELNAKGFASLCEYPLNHNMQKVGVARSFFQQAVSLDAEYAEGWNNLGWALYLQENYDEALSAFDTALQHKPDLIDALAGKGLILYQQKRDFLQARAALEEAVQLNPSSYGYQMYLGHACLQTDDWDAAMRHYGLAVRLLNNHPQRKLQAVNMALTTLENAAFDHYVTASKYHQAASLLLKLPSVVEILGVVDRVWEIYELLALVYEHLEDYERTIELRQKAIAEYQKVTAESAISDASLQLLKSITRGYSSSHDYVAYAYYQIGMDYVQLRKFDQALANCQKAATLYQNQQDKLGEANVRSDLNHIYYVYAKDYTKAYESAQAALKLYQELGDLKGEAKSWMDLGSACKALDQYKEAQKYYLSALRLFEKLNDRKGQAKAHSRLGRSYSIFEGEQGSHDFQKALRHYKMALDIHTELGDLSATLEDYDDIISVYTWIDPDKASEYAQAAEAVCNNLMEEIRGVAMKTTSVPERSESQNRLDKTRLANFYADVALLRYWQGKYENAIDYYRRAIELGDNMDLKAFRYRSIAQALLEIGRFDEAATYVQHAVDYYRSIHDKQGEIQIYELMANVLMGRFEPRAIEYLEKAVSAARGGQLYQSVIQYEARLCQNYLLIGQMRATIYSSENRMGVFENKVLVYQSMARLLFKMDTLKPSSGYDKEVFYYIERSKARGLLELLAHSQALVVAGVSTEMLEQERQYQNQLVALDRRFMEETKRPVSQQRPELIQWLNRKRTEVEAEFQRFRTELERLYPKYAGLKYPQSYTYTQAAQEILTEDTVLLEYAVPISREDVFRKIFYETGMQHQQGVLLYVMANDLSQPLIYRLEIDNLDELVSEYRETLSHPLIYEERDSSGKIHIVDNTKKHHQFGYQLYEKLLKPVLDEHSDLLKSKRLLIIPDGILHYLPFETLITNPPETGPPRYLIQQDFRFSYAPSASVLGEIKQEDNRRKAKLSRINRGEIVAIGDAIFDPTDLQAEQKKQMDIQQNLQLAQAGEPEKSANWSDRFGPSRAVYERNGYKLSRLPYVAEELAGIRAVYGDGSKIYQRLEATEELVKSGVLKNFKIVHFVTHGILNEQVPRLSAIALNQDEEPQEDGFLTMGEIFNLELNADLVVLSACQTGLGKRVKGEGLVGLTRAFLYAGTPSLIVSLWSVNDESTAYLMKVFYRNLHGGMSKEEALRTAKKKLMEHRDEFDEPIYREPYYWAPFILIGEIN